MPLVLDPSARDNIEPFKKRRGLLAAMCFYDTDDEIDILPTLRLGSLQHLESLANPGGCSKKDLQATARFASRLFKECPGRRAIVAIRLVLRHTHLMAIPRPVSLHRRLFAGHFIECKVELQHIDVRLAEETEKPALCVFGNKLAKAGFGQVPRAGDARHLEKG